MNTKAGHVLAAGAMIVAACALPATAAAGLRGPCTAALAGADVATRGGGATAKPITVAHHAMVPIVMSASSGAISHVRIKISFAGISWTVKDKNVTTPVYRDTIPVKNYAKYGVGLYKVEGTATGAGFSCSGDALVKVQGNPIASVAGAAGLAALVLGALGLLAAGLGAAAGPLAVVRGSVAGLLTAVGAVVLLQQFAVLYPTTVVAVVGIVLGLAAGTAAPFLHAFHPPGLHHGGGAVTGPPATPAV